MPYDAELVLELLVAQGLDAILLAATVHADQAGEITRRISAAIAEPLNPPGVHLILTE